MPAVLLNAALPAPGHGPGGPSAPVGPVPPEGGFAATLGDAAPATAVPVQAPELAFPSPVSGLPSGLPSDPPGPLPPLSPEPAPATMPAQAAPPGWPPPGLAALFPASGQAALPGAAAPAPVAAGSLVAPPAPAVVPALVSESVPSPAQAAPPLPVATPLRPGPALTPAKPSSLVEAALAARAGLPRVAAGFDRSAEAGVPALLSDAADAALGRLTGSAEAAGLQPWAAVPASGLPRPDLAAAFPTPLPLHDRRFAESLGNRVQWLAEQGGGEVRLRLAPEGLGPVEIRLQLDGERVDLAMHAVQAETRQALEQALPRLREMLAQNGLQLGQADVGQGQGQTPQDGERKAAAAASVAAGVGDATAGPLLQVEAPRRGNGLLDLYA